MRRITLHRPGEEDVILVTDLLDADTYPAEDLLALTWLAGASSAYSNRSPKCFT